jgi:hypothetical protein
LITPSITAPPPAGRLVFLSAPPWTLRVHAQHDHARLQFGRREILDELIGPSSMNI